MIVITNASPLLALAQADCLTTDLLRLAEQRRIIPSAAEVVLRLREARIFLPWPATVVQ